MATKKSPLQYDILRDARGYWFRPRFNFFPVNYGPFTTRKDALQAAAEHLAAWEEV